VTFRSSTSLEWGALLVRGDRRTLGTNYYTGNRRSMHLANILFRMNFNQLLSTRLGSSSCTSSVRSSVWMMVLTSDEEAWHLSTYAYACWWTGARRWSTWYSLAWVYVTSMLSHRVWRCIGLGTN
jgi:hypothetical protein